MRKIITSGITLDPQLGESFIIVMEGSDGQPVTVYKQPLSSIGASLDVHDSVETRVQFINSVIEGGPLTPEEIEFMTSYRRPMEQL